MVKTRGAIGFCLDFFVSFWVKPKRKCKKMYDDCGKRKVGNSKPTIATIGFYNHTLHITFAVTNYSYMNQFKIVPLPKEYATRLRNSGKDDFGHNIIEQTATGHGPCRVSLKPFKPGVDKRLLFTHSPFAIDNAFNQPGPIFINADDVEEYTDIYRFPPEIKADKEHFALTLIGYSTEQMMVYTQLVGDKDVDDLIIKIFDEHPEVAYLHARSAEACCFICKIERV